MKFREFITGGNSASVSSMCRAAVLMAVFIPGAVYGRLSDGDGWSLEHTKA